MIVLKNTDKKIDIAIQVSDIHIRLTKRHDEYTTVFDRFYLALDKLSKNAAGICVITGDVFHNKSDLSPECVKIGGDFLKGCADRIPTILIAGNHDATLANKNRLDCLTPIVDALHHPNLYYLKSTDIFRYENILFNHFSVFDDPDKYIKYDNIPIKYRLATDHHIALFHGPVNNAITDVGYTVSNRAITNDLFDGHHMVMLGDIHKHQRLTTEKIVTDEELKNINMDDWELVEKFRIRKKFPVMAYASSMIQQNHGEELRGHGFLAWDLKRRLFKHYELLNDYGFYTVEISKGELLTDISDIPKKLVFAPNVLKQFRLKLKRLLIPSKQNARFWNQLLSESMSAIRKHPKSVKCWIFIVFLTQTIKTH